jgi:hypothetical protein
MATFSKKMMGKEVGDASIYAKPHTMNGKAMALQGSDTTPPNMSNPDTLNMSVNSFSNKRAAPAKTTGIKMRGAGAATKGVMSRGPMA